MKNKHSKEKEFKLSSVILFIFRIICLIVMIYSGYRIYVWHKENVENDKLKNSFENVVIEAMSDDKTKNNLDINFEELLKRNSESVGWIKVNNTNINYPIVQHSDNDYYLTHNFENIYNSSGWVYLDYRNNIHDLDPNTIIYGHNRWNDSMFGTLKNALETSWCDNEDNRYICFSTLTHKYVAQIFSVYKIDVNNLTVPNDFSSTEEYQDYLTGITNLSYYNFNTLVTTNDKILTLYTCDNNSAYRVIVHAKIMESE